MTTLHTRYYEWIDRSTGDNPDISHVLGSDYMDTRYLSVEEAVDDFKFLMEDEEPDPARYRLDKVVEAREEVQW